MHLLLRQWERLRQQLRDRILAPLAGVVVGVEDAGAAEEDSNDPVRRAFRAGIAAQLSVIVEIAEGDLVHLALSELVCEHRTAQLAGTDTIAAHILAVDAMVRDLRVVVDLLQAARATEEVIALAGALA